MSNERDQGADEPLSERKMLSVTPEMARRIDDYRFRHRFPTESAAIRKLLSLGLERAEEEDRTGPESSP
ncbi:MAG: hypothetical protein EA406_13290 [Rhodospirillales bacterium]|nr:MAG: hypothetical protein EA406_13290 [Rhodospirillales bacterium]